MTTFLAVLALGAGAVAAFNPCGAALFPSYLAFLFRGEDAERGAVARGLEAGLFMTLGFFTVFALAGLLVGTLAQALLRVAPVLSVAIAAALLVLGVLAMTGRLALPGLERALDLGGAGEGPRPVGLYGYGLAYAVTSLSCALPVFLAIALQSIGRGLGTAVVSFLFYALGMGLVITAASILTFAARDWVQRHIMGAQAWVGRAMGVVLAASGTYLLWYWLLGPEHLL